MQTSQQLTGKKGEDHAAGYLVSLGMEIIHRNWRTVHAEVDIIAKDKGVLVFVEVKTRKNLAFGHPSAAVGAAKFKAVSRAIRLYIQQHQWAGEVRVDIISVILSGDKAVIAHIPEAYTSFS